jgi:glycosyltransferase involved in cell wall biosynthesis
MNPPDRGTAKIVGIVLVRNEDIFVSQAVKNIASFCDTLILCDHGSTDGTAGILDGLARSLPHAAVHRLAHPSGSHDLLKAFAGTHTWVFGVDGDELYDPRKLQDFRPRLLAGEFDHIWRMKGNVLHCTALAPDRSTATGHMAPPSRSITKLYNFSAITSWDGDTVERLHGGTIRFQPGFDDGMKRNFQDELGWDESPLRCLHTCFLPRSSRDFAGAEPAVRKNIMEIYRGGIGGVMRRFAGRLLRQQDSRWKKDFYQRGSVETVDARPYFL